MYKRFRSSHVSLETSFLEQKRHIPPWLGLSLTLWVYTIGLLLASCGANSLVDCDRKTSWTQSCVEKTPDEQAVLALNAGDWDRAQTLLESLIAEFPNEYFRYPRLAVVYAKQGGFDLLAIDQLTIPSSSQAASSQADVDSSNLVDQMGTFLPSPKTSSKEAYAAYLAKIAQAKNLILEMPEDERKKNSDVSYGANAELQLTLYQAAYSVMFMNKFTVSADSLGEMTLSDARVIIENLKEAALNSAQVSPDMAAHIDEVLAKIDGMEGEDDKAKLDEFLKQHQGAANPS